jgi:hypothetical protein
MNGDSFGGAGSRRREGLFCGHDHVNNYVGLYRGVALGYDGVIGYAAFLVYRRDPPEPSRGGRVFLIKESDPWHFKTG